MRTWKACLAAVSIAALCLCACTGRGSAPEAPEGGPEGIDFAALEAQNPDTVGWIAIPGTEIDFPVVQGEADEYLHTSFEGREDRQGCPFLDPCNSPDFTDAVSFIYGHSFIVGGMFSELPDYSEPGFFAEHGEIVLDTPGGTFSLAPWAVVRVSGSDGSLHYGEFPDEEAWDGYKAEVASRAVLTDGRPADGVGSLVCLVSCSYNSYDERTLVFCEKGEADA